ncbi:MAG: DegV family protein [Lachnospiraceae bacterium]|nr:DegV family protein [Candidatus Merdinaster equi]
MIKIIVDSCADLSQELLEKYDIDYARMNTVKDGNQTEASLSWEFYSPKQLYDTIRNGEKVTTTQVPVEEFMRVFKLYLDQGYDIIYVGCSTKQSGSVNVGYMVAKQLLPEYEGRRIECIDSLNASIGEGMLGILATELMWAGKDFDEIVSIVKESRNKVNEFVTVHSLEYLKRAGRVKASKAFFGNLMGVKPVLISDANGEQTAVKKARGRMGSLQLIVDSLAEVIEDAGEQTVYIAHADCGQEEIEQLKVAIKEKIACKNIEVVYIGPIVGASVGPDAIGVFAFGKEVTYKASEN